MDFKATHEFRGLPLMLVGGSASGMCYVDCAKRKYTLPKGIVREINSVSPKAGEVWICTFTERHHSRFPLYIVDDEAKYFVSADELCEVKIDEHTVSDFAKVLNADGTPVG